MLEKFKKIYMLGSNNDSQKSFSLRPSDEYCLGSNGTLLFPSNFSYIFLLANGSAWKKKSFY